MTPARDRYQWKNWNLFVTCLKASLKLICDAFETYLKLSYYLLKANWKATWNLSETCLKPIWNLPGNRKTKWWKHIIDSKINTTSNANAWYTRNFHLRTCNPITLSSCNLKKLIAFCKVADQNYECIMRLHHLFCWFSNVSCVFITLFVDFRLYQAFPSLFLMIFDCIMRFTTFLLIF